MSPIPFLQGHQSLDFRSTLFEGEHVPRSFTFVGIGTSELDVCFWENTVRPAEGLGAASTALGLCGPQPGSLWSAWRVPVLERQLMSTRALASQLLGDFVGANGTVV